MTLNAQASGNGPDLVLVHGWGLHSGIWDTLLPLLEPAWRVTRVDLPGHGGSDWSGEQSLDDMVGAVLSSVPQQAAWVGWSLGGLVALRAALLEPGRVTALTMLAGTPCFMRRPDWQSAMLPALLETFAADLARDYRATLNRFLALQVRGSDNPSAVLRQLRARLFAAGVPVAAALQAGLAVLHDTDLRDGLPRLATPVQWLMGERDTLVPLTAGRAAAAMTAGSRLDVIAGAGHAPFIAEPRQVAACLQAFLAPDMKDD